MESSIVCGAESLPDSEFICNAVCRSDPGNSIVDVAVKRQKLSYYADLAADFSRPGLVSDEQKSALLQTMRTIHGLKAQNMPAIDNEYTLATIHAENKEWFPTHCNALREERFDLLNNEYRDEFVYLCQDGPFHGKGAASIRERNWVAIIAQPNATMNWPIVQFSGEAVYFEWASRDDITNKTIAKGNVTFIRRGHRGGIYLKTEQLTFFRDVEASAALLAYVKA